MKNRAPKMKVRNKRMRQTSSNNINFLRQQYFIAKAMGYPAVTHQSFGTQTFRVASDKPNWEEVERDRSRLQ